MAGHVSLRFGFRAVCLCSVGGLDRARVEAAHEDRGLARRDLRKLRLLFHLVPERIGLSDRHSVGEDLAEEPLAVGAPTDRFEAEIRPRDDPRKPLGLARGLVPDPHARLAPLRRIESRPAPVGGPGHAPARTGCIPESDVLPRPRVRQRGFHSRVPFGEGESGRRIDEARTARNRVRRFDRVRDPLSVGRQKDRRPTVVSAHRDRDGERQRLVELAGGFRADSRDRRKQEESQRNTDHRKPELRPHRGSFHKTRVVHRVTAFTALPRRLRPAGPSPSPCGTSPRRLRRRSRPCRRSGGPGSPQGSPAAASRSRECSASA